MSCRGDAVAGFETVVGDLEGAQFELRPHCSPIRSRTYNLLVGLLPSESVQNLILDLKIHT